jgi:hypothetical protein
VVLGLLFTSPLFFVEFYLRTQTGHRICDEKGPCFTSHFTESELRALARDRMERWQGVAPGSLTGENEEPVFWRREDYFLTEARAHLRLANHAAASGNPRVACIEMTVLTTHYAPSLHGLAAAPERLSCAEEELGGGESRAFQHLDTGARPFVFRASAAAAALVLLALGAAVSRRPVSEDRS